MKQQISTSYIEFSDSRLTEIYDIINPFSADTEFYLHLAKKLKARTVVDIGCGTGLLACELANRGCSVVGVEPESAMLDVARNRYNDGGIEWIEGTASQLGKSMSDLILMTGHVSQVFLDDAIWHETLRIIHGALHPNGYLSFESRNPTMEPWKAWTQEKTYREIDHVELGTIGIWSEFEYIENGRVRYSMHYIFQKSGEELMSTNELKFRTQTEIEQSLREAGFVIQEIYGDWNGDTVTNESKEIIFLAQKQ